MPPKSHIIWLEQTDSTNAELRRRMDSLANLSAVAAACQSSGRGQGSHTWHSAPGENLTCSVLLRFPPDGEGRLAASGAEFITRIITLSILAILEEEGVREAWVKWPNDIWVGERKICGILIENLIRGGSVSESIVGIGLNLNECLFPAELPNPVSLRQLTGRQSDPGIVLERLLSHISLRQGQYLDPSSRHLLVESFDAVCHTLEEGWHLHRGEQGHLE